MVYVGPSGSYTSTVSRILGYTVSGSILEVVTGGVRPTCPPYHIKRHSECEL